MQLQASGASAGARRASLKRWLERVAQAQSGSCRDGEFAVPPGKEGPTLLCASQATDLCRTQCALPWRRRTGTQDDNTDNSLGATRSLGHCIPAREGGARQGKRVRSRRVLRVDIGISSSPPPARARCFACNCEAGRDAATLIRYHASCMGIWKSVRPQSAPVRVQGGADIHERHSPA